MTSGGRGAAAAPRDFAESAGWHAHLRPPSSPATLILFPTRLWKSRKSVKWTVMPVTLSFSPISEPGAADVITLFARRAEKAKKKKEIHKPFDLFFRVF